MVQVQIFAALAAADLPKREWLVLSEILLQVYGPEKRREAHVSPRELMRYSDLADKNVYRALRGLEARGIIRSTKRGSYTFVKDFEKYDGMSEGDLRYARSAVDRYGVRPERKPRVKKGKDENIDGIQQDTASIQLDTEKVSNGIPNQPETVSNGIPALNRTARNSELRMDINHHHDDEPITDKNGEPYEPEIKNDPAEVVRVAKSTHTLLKRDFVSQVHSCAALFPIDWIERAIQDASTWPDLLSSFQPILNRLRRWQTAKPPGPPAIEATRKGYTAPAGPIIPHADQSQPAEPPKVKLWATNSIHNPNRKPKTS